MAVVKACDVKVNASVQNQSFVYKLETIIKWCSWSSIPATPPPRSAFNFLDTNCILAWAKK